MSLRTSTSFEPRIVLRPRTLDETLDLSLAYLQRGVRDFVPLTLLVIPLEVAFLVAAAMVTRGDGQSWRATIVTLLLVTSVFERAVTVFTGRHLFGNQARATGSLRAALAVMPNVAALSALAWMPVLLGVVLWESAGESAGLIAVVVMLGMAWPFLLAGRVHTLEAYLLEQLPLRRALDRARTLVLFRYARALGLFTSVILLRLLFMVVVHGLVVFVIEVLLQFSNISALLGFWPAIAGYLVAGPFIAIVRVFDYVDTRTRTEGWDIQVRFSALAHRALAEAEARELRR